MNGDNRGKADQKKWVDSPDVGRFLHPWHPRSSPAVVLLPAVAARRAARKASPPDVGPSASATASETNTWRTALRESIEETVAAYDNIDLLVTDANDSPAKQVADLEDLLAKGVDGLIIGAANTM